ncbi:hypothetical protein AVEN_154385-1 [Araneus ventricosus]|uniref:Uncharacterized protein n=1 Tax=Araneus ventricosus TaxID=182803 RepID=A0A4Y2QMA4_ARAVE|nr:hypothetical protein AVEN_154385-1 [Araneus ventricosus]
MFKFFTYHGIPIPDKPLSIKSLHSTTKFNEDDELSCSYTSNLKDFATFFTSLQDQIENYTKNKTQDIDDILDKVGHIFKFDYLIFPRSDASIEFVFTPETFSNFISCFLSQTPNVDKDYLFFEYKQLCLCFQTKISKSREENVLC